MALESAVLTEMSSPDDRSPYSERATRAGYRAVSGGRQSTGGTPGQALDALTAQLDEAEVGTLVVIQLQQADEFFKAAQRGRLEELMARWRAARECGKALPNDEQAELERLVDVEVEAAGRRAEAAAHSVGR